MTHTLDHIRHALDQAQRALHDAQAALAVWEQQQAALPAVTPPKTAKPDPSKAGPVITVPAAPAPTPAQAGEPLDSPLTAVMDYLMFLQENEGLSDQAHAYVSDAVMAYLNFLQDEADGQLASRPSSAHLLSLINDLLEYAKILQGARPSDWVEVPLRATLREVHQTLAARAASKQLAYSLQLDAALPAYVGMDAASLTLVLIEVLDNAIKFTETGHVHTEVSMLSPPTEEDTAGVLCILVRDSGLGVAVQDQQRMFEPFVQLVVSKDGEQDDDLFGHGLGLAMAQQLAHSHQAELHVVSTVGVGTTMAIHWPVQIVATPPEAVPERAADASAQPAMDDPAAPRPEAPLRILVVDDHQLNRLVALSALKRSFAHAVLDEAKNGTEAFEKMSSQPYDVVLMDLVMPDLPGTEVVRRVRALPAPLGTVPVAALTANIADEALAECAEVGIEHVLSKPLDLDMLVKTIRTLVGSVDQRSQY